MKIEFTSDALRDLDDLQEYLEEQSPSCLANLLGDIEKMSSQKLGKFSD